ncbi:hypothetical protein LTR67_000553 [Exophiala xenobiotica]
MSSLHSDNGMRPSRRAAVRLMETQPSSRDPNSMVTPPPPYSPPRQTGDYKVCGSMPSFTTANTMGCPTPEVQKTKHSTASDSTASGSSSESRLKSSYVQTRLDGFKKREAVLNQKMAVTKQKEGSRRHRIAELRIEQEQVKLLHAGEETAFENARKAFEEARTRLNSKECTLKRVQDELEDCTESIKEEEKSVAELQANQGRIEQEIRELQAVQDQAARQAEILDLKAFEISALVEHAQSNKAFLAKLSRIAQGTGTETMYKDLQSELWAKSTGASTTELKTLVATELLPKIDQKATLDKDAETPTEHGAHDRAGRKRKADLVFTVQSDKIDNSNSENDSEGELVRSFRGRRAQRLQQRAQKEKVDRAFKPSEKKAHGRPYWDPITDQLVWK